MSVIIVVCLVFKYDKNLVEVINKFHFWTFNCDMHKYKKI